MAATAAQASAFEAALNSDGYTQVVNRALPGGHATPPHAHDFSVRALVTEGEITLTTDAGATTYRAGEVFVMPAGCTHRETVGADGVAYVAGTRPM